MSDEEQAFFPPFAIKTGPWRPGSPAGRPPTAAGYAPPMDADRPRAAVIPPRRNRKVRESVDGRIYALRDRIERRFNRLRNARRVAARCDETAASFPGFVQIASIRLWGPAFKRSGSTATRSAACCTTPRILRATERGSAAGQDRGRVPAGEFA